MVGADRQGAVIATGTLPAGSRCEAVRDRAPDIDLIDGDGLLLKVQKIGVRVKMVEEVTVDEAAFAGF